METGPRKNDKRQLVDVWRWLWVGDVIGTQGSVHQRQYLMRDNTTVIEKWKGPWFTPMDVRSWLTEALMQFDATHRGYPDILSVVISWFDLTLILQLEEGEKKLFAVSCQR